MRRLFHKSMAYLLVFALLLSGNTVFAGITSIEQKDQGSTFNPKLNEFKTVITLDESVAVDDAANNSFATYTAALEKAKYLSASEKPVLINVKPGEYSAASGAANIDNLVIRGVSGNPEDVVITATNGSYVVELGRNLASGGFSNYTLENITLKLTYNASGSPKQTTGIQVGGTGLNQDITFRNLIIDAEGDNLSGQTINGIYLFNGENITVDNVEVKTAAPDTTRAVVLASTSDSTVKGISGNCTIPVSALDYYNADTSGAYVADFPSNNYVEGAEFIIAVSRYGRYSYIMAPTYEKAYEYTSLELSQGVSKLRTIIDVTNNQLIVDDRLTSFGAMENYLVGTDTGNDDALDRERANSDNWYDTKNVALVNPSGNYNVNVEGLTITAYDENYSANSFIPITGISFSGEAVTVDNFDFSDLPDPTLEGLIKAGVLPPGSVVDIGDGSDIGNIIWAKMNFDPNGGTVSTTTAIMKCGMYSGKDIQLPQPQRVGYQFSGWFTQPDGQGTDQIMLGTEGVTVYAKWSKKIQPANHVPMDKDTITVPDNNSGTNPNSIPNSSPRTDDSTGLTKLVIILCFSILCLATLLRVRRELKGR